MWALSPASEELLLHFLIQGCLWLTTGSVVLWLGCFGYRLHRLRLIQQDEALEEKLTGLVLEEISGEISPSRPFTRLPTGQRRILLRVIQNLIARIKGSDQAKLIALLQREGFMDAALQTLAAGRADERQAACALLSYHADPAALAALHRALGDPDLGVRLTASRALLQKDQIASLGDLLTKLNLSPDDPPLFLAEIFTRLPARLRNEAAHLLGSPIADEWKRMLAIALGRNQVHEAFPAIAVLCQSTVPRVRAAAWVALREMGDPLASPLLLAALHDPSATVRQAACQFAGAHGDHESLPALRQLLADPDWWVRFAAASALYDFGGEGRQMLELYCITADDLDVGLQVLRERDMEYKYGS
jgi:hypothetical protein